LNIVLSEASFQRADIQLYESMLKIKVPVAQNINELRLKQRSKYIINDKLNITIAILKKYKHLIYKKIESNAKKEGKQMSWFGLENAKKKGSDESVDSQFSIEIATGIFIVIIVFRRGKGRHI
jgi:hypothetical protein